MALTINTNVAALAAQRNLAATQNRIGGNVAKLSSGLRIVQAADDAAGLAISEKLKAQLAGLSQAERNANDGISMIQVAEGAMNEQSGILNRLRELAVQAANGSLGSVERGFIDTERTQLVDEMSRISAATEFNGTYILGADSGTTSFHVGIRGTSNDQISVAFEKTDASTLGIGSLSFSTAASALTALAMIDTALNSLSTSRANLGGVQNRLGITITNLATAQENTAAANSRIRDVDVAKETASLTRNQILSQAGVSVLAQANQLPQLALSLLG